MTHSKRVCGARPSDPPPPFSLHLLPPRRTSPQLLWEEGVLRALLDAVDALARRTRQGSGPTLGAAAVAAERAAAGGASAGGGSGADAVLVSDPFRESARLYGAAKRIWRRGRAFDSLTLTFPSSPRHATPFPATSVSAALRTPSSPYAMFAPTQQAELADVLADVTELALQWVLRASAAAPHETRSLFQKFVSRAALAASRGGARSNGSSFGGGGTAGGEDHFGLLVALHGMSPPWSSLGGGGGGPGPLPLVRPFGLVSRVQAASNALLVGQRVGGVPAASAPLAAQMQLLAAADVRVRLGGVGAAAPSAGGGAAAREREGGGGGGGAGFGAASTDPVASSGSAAGRGAGSASGPGAGAAASPFAGPAQLRALDGFFASSWARTPPRALVRGDGETRRAHLSEIAHPFSSLLPHSRRL